MTLISWEDDDLALKNDLPSSDSQRDKNEIKVATCNLPLLNGEECLIAACISYDHKKIAFIGESKQTASITSISRDPLHLIDHSVAFSLPQEMTQLSVDDVSISFSPRGQFLSIGLSSRYGSVIGIWDSIEGRCLRMLPLLPRANGGLSFICEKSESYEEKEEEEARLAVMMPNDKVGRVEIWGLGNGNTQPDEIVYLGAGGRQFRWGVGGQGGVSAFVPSLGYRLSLFQV